MKKCLWRSKANRNQRCTLPIVGNFSNHYCIFHQPDKQQLAAQLFWAIINYDPFIGLTEADIQTIYFRKNTTFQEHSQISQRIENGHRLNLQLLNNKGYDVQMLIPLLEKYKYFNIQGNFNGFIFPRNWSEYFNYQFPFPHSYYRLSFVETIFEDIALFDNYHFSVTTIFKNTNFNQAYSFQNAKFSRDIFFFDIKKEGGGKNNPFYNSEISGDLFRIQGKTLIDFRGLKFSENTDISLPILTNPEIKTAAFYSELYRIAKTQSIKIGNYEKAGENYFVEMNLIGLSYKSEKLRSWNFRDIKKYFSNRLAKYAFGYGEKPSSVISFSSFIILLYSIVYKLILNKPIGESIFISASTFTTLGFGININTFTGFLYIMFATEAFFGVIMISLFVLTLSKRYSR